MHCQSCEQRIKGNIRFVKGTKIIDTSVGEQKVTIVYAPQKGQLRCLCGSLQENRLRNKEAKITLFLKSTSQRGDVSKVLKNLISGLLEPLETACCG